MPEWSLLEPKQGDNGGGGDMRGHAQEREVMSHRKGQKKKWRQAGAEQLFLGREKGEGRDG